MRILITNPPWWSSESGGVWTAGVRAGSRWPFTAKVKSSPDRFRWGDYLPSPMFLQFSASFLRDAMPEATVVFRDSIALRESYSNFLGACNEQIYDFIVVESASPCWEHDATLIRSLPLRSRVIVTGPVHVNAAAILERHPTVWAVVKGEPEKGLVRVIRDGARGVIDFDFLTEVEMNAAPIPYMDHRLAHRYWDPCPAGQRAPQAQIWTSRGCWAKCCFCLFPAVMTSNDPDGTRRRTVRHYSPEYVSTMLAEWVTAYHFRSIWIDDDLFNTSDRHVLGMCEVLGATGLPWSAMCRADGIKHATWRAMKEAGCFGVKVGFESASQRVLDEIVNKRLDLDEAIDTLKYLKSIDLQVHTTWTVGLPGETKEEQQQTIDQIKEFYDMGLHSTHQLSGTAVLDGTPLAQIGTGLILPTYPGARADENYLAEGDGMRKLGMMQESK
jgi:hypothetical protein